MSAPLRRAELVEAVRAFRSGIAHGAELSAIQPQARGLYERLIAPVREFLRDDRLLIVPNDVLYYLPFAALQGPDGRWLADERTLTILPSASVLKYVGTTAVAGAESPLALGDPAITNARRLPHAQDEVHILGARYHGATVLVGAAATETVVKRRGGRAGILHFATHAELKEERPLTSALLLTPGDGEDGRLEVAEIFELSLRARLVVLSACATGLGRLSRGDEIVGLQRAFLSAGARAIVSTLWAVEDVATL